MQVRLLSPPPFLFNNYRDVRNLFCSFQPGVILESALSRRNSGHRLLFIFNVMSSHTTRSAAAILALLLWSLVGHAQQKTFPPYISAKHQQVLQRWLSREPDLRVAVDEDCGRCASDIANQKTIRGAEYHPYYAVGDFNGDGKPDFAVALIEVEAEGERATQKWVVAVFNAPLSSRVLRPVFMKKDLNLRDGGLFFGPPRPKPYRLSIGLFSTDSGLTLVPRGRTYVAN